VKSVRRIPLFVGKRLVEKANDLSVHASALASGARAHLAQEAWRDVFDGD